MPRGERAAAEGRCNDGLREDESTVGTPETPVEDGKEQGPEAASEVAPESPPLPVAEALRPTEGDTLAMEVPASAAPGGSPVPPAQDTGGTVATPPTETGTERASSTIGALGREIPAGLQAAALKLEERQAGQTPSPGGPTEPQARGLEAARRESHEATSQDSIAKLDIAPGPEAPKLDLVRDQPAFDPKSAAVSALPAVAGPAPERVLPPAVPTAGAAVPVLHQVPLGAVPIEIGLKTLAGVNRFEIRLDPAELGRIDVTLEIGEGGQVKAHLVVDRVETLGLLQRDARTLERAFEQAGLKPSDGGVDLSLRDPSSDGRPQDRGRDPDQDRRGQKLPEDGGSAKPDALTDGPARRHVARLSGVDLRI